MIGLLCSLALAADLPIPSAPSPARKHTAIVLVHTGEFTAGSGLITALGGVIAWRSGACSGDGARCSLGIAGAVTTGVGLAGVALALPILVSGALLPLDQGTEAASTEHVGERRGRALRASVGVGPGGILAWGEF